MREQDRHAKSVLRVSGVPYFLFHSNEKGVTPMGISGAQPPDVSRYSCTSSFVQLFTHAFNLLGFGGNII